MLGTTLDCTAGPKSGPQSGPLPAEHEPVLSVTGLVLAGGRGSRMGGVEKGLQRLAGQALVQIALQRLRSQSGLAVAACAINANRELAAYAAFGVPVWPDPVGDCAGPLAGFAAGLQHGHTPWLLTVPCDVPRFPLDLLARLAQGVQSEQADLAVAAAPDADGVLRLQPVFCLLKADLLPSLLRYIGQGGSKVQAWSRQQRCAVVPFDAPADDPRAFDNLNTWAQLQAAGGRFGAA